MKKVLAITLSVIMIVLCMTGMAFATEQYPNFAGGLLMDNWNCVHGDDCQVSVKISKEGMEDILIPLEYDDWYGYYYFEGRVDGLDGIINEVGGLYDAALGDDGMGMPDGLALMEEKGYTLDVIVEDNDDNHNFIPEDSVVALDFLTAKSLRVSLELFVEIMEELILEFDPNYEPAGSFDALMVKYKELLESEDYIEYLMTEEEYTEEEAKEEIEESLAEVYELEEMIAQLESGTYAGEMMLTYYLACDCPELVEYTLYHEYYDENGEYVAQEMDFPTAENGAVIKVEELLITEYDGVEYEVEGVYLYNEELGDFDWDSPLDEFTVVDDYDEETGTYLYTEVLIKYVPVEKDLGGGQGNADDGNSNVPITSDDSNLMLYVLLMSAAVVAFKKVKA